MADPAIRQVVLALESVLSAALPSVTVLIDKTDGEPVTVEQMPAINIRPIECVFETEYGANSFEHIWSLAFDLYSGSSAMDSIDQRQAEMVSAMVAAIKADAVLPTLSHWFEPDSWSAAEDSVPDVGCATFNWILKFFTPADDWNTIIGPSGIVT